MKSQEINSGLQQFNQLFTTIIRTSVKMDEIYSLNLLQSLINGHPYLPFTRFALRPFCLIHIINEIVINNRKTIIEFGAGLSTILMGRLFKANNLNCTVLSIEHDADWRNQVTDMLIQENLQDKIKVVHAPLTKSGYSDTLWYDVGVLEQHTENKKFDMIIIDGPPAWEKEKEQARYPAMPFMMDKVDNSFSVFLDDADRTGEQSLLLRWKNEFGMDFKIMAGRLARYLSQNAWVTDPF